METIRILLGGSPCTHWSIAQTKDRETEPSGIGWELFLNYRIARDKYKPDFFLYENNKSMAPAIRAQITKELGVEPVLINSALVSAQSRQRLYWAGKRNQDGTYSQVAVEQPEDRGIILRDVLESGFCWREKGYALLQEVAATPEDMIARRQRNGAAEPVRIGTIESAAQNADFDSQQYRVYSPDGKSVTLCGNGGGVGAKTGLYAVPDKPIRVCNINGGGQGNRIYDANGKSCALKAQSGGLGGHGQGLYAVQTKDGYALSNVITDKKTYPVYHVQSGLITIKDRQYPIRLADGFYIIRKLTVTECKRLQTVPEGYVFPVSDTQAYKMLGNGWTVDVIAHILSHFDGITTEPVEVLSMYDGMSCGHIALDKLGADVVGYYATETDKYAVQTTMENYPETVQMGDAFQVRQDGWTRITTGQEPGEVHMDKLKPCLDVTCGGRMMWFDKQNPACLFLDNREATGVELCDGRKFSIHPDMMADFTNLPLPDNSFYLVAFDPPHLVRAGDDAYMAIKYGKLPEEWPQVLRKGFRECMRVLRPGGTLIFKWNEYQIPVRDVLEAIGEKPLFGQRSGKASKTHWMTFMKMPEEAHP